MLIACSVAIVLIIPLLLDIGNLANTYYAAKARALYILAPIIVLSLISLRQISPSVTDPGILRPVGFYIAAAIAATILGINPLWSVFGASWRSEGLLTLLTYPVVLMGTLASVRLGYLRVWLAAVLGGATIVAAYGIAQYFGFEWLVRDGLRVGWWEAFSTTGHMNYLGGYMVLLLPLALVTAVTASSRRTLILSVIALLTMFCAALFTHSRAAWASMILALAGMAVFFPRDPWSRFRRFAMLLAGLAVIMGVFLVPRGPLAPRPAWATQPISRAWSALAVDTPSVQVRPYLWRTTVPLLLKRPLLGYGPEAFSLVYPQHWDLEKQHYFGTFPRTIDKAHNDTLDTAMSIGIFGLAAYWWILAVGLHRSWTISRQPGDTRLIGLACAVGITAFWFDLQFGFSAVSVAPVFWSVLGAAAGLAPAAPREAA